MKSSSSKVVLLTGATGYVGGRLLKQLESADYNVFCLSRNKSFLQSKISTSTTIIQGDLLEKNSLDFDLPNIDVAFYMVHSMGNNKNFADQDRLAVQNFLKLAKVHHVKRIIYLGGLGDESQDLSSHLKSRHEVGKILRNSSIQIIEFRASIVIGSGSLSFEMIRSLTEKLPIMIMPKWVNVLSQPINIESLLKYLFQAIEVEISESEIIEIGGLDKLSYKDLMATYAKIRKLKRVMISVPILTPYLSSLWLGLVTPLYARIGRKLIDSIKHETTVSSKNSSLHLFNVIPMRPKEAIERALNHEDEEFTQTRWSDSISSTGLQPSILGSKKKGSRLLDIKEKIVNVPIEKAFTPISKIGGKNGWYAFNTLWKIRGAIDLLIGGVGMRRGRPRRDKIFPGDAIDFWRVEAIEKNKYLKLMAEMKLPGKAWLEFEVIEVEGGSKIIQTTTFYPSGLLGLCYWYGIYPLHALVFRQMINKIAEKALLSN